MGDGLKRAKKAAEATRMSVRDRVIAAGVKNLKEYGYPSVNASNILTDRIYSAFFKSMLQDNLGKGYDADVNALLADIERATVAKD